MRGLRPRGAWVAFSAELVWAEIEPVSRSLPDTLRGSTVDARLSCGVDRFRDREVNARSLPLVLLALFVTARTLAGVAAILQPFLRVDYDLWFELGMVSGQVLVQWSILWRRSWAERIDYAGVLLSVSFIGAVLLWPLLLWHHVAPVAPIAAALYFFAVVAVIFAIHVRLVLRRKLPKVLCSTWVLYRLVILLGVAKIPSWR